MEIYPAAFVDFSTTLVVAFEDEPRWLHRQRAGQSQVKKSKMDRVHRDRAYPRLLRLFFPSHDPYAQSNLSANLIKRLVQEVVEENTRDGTRS